MKIVFMGTSNFSLGILKHLAKHHKILAVITQEDQPRGRGKKIMSPPVKDFALEQGWDVFQVLPSSQDLAKYPADILLVAAYGKILPKELLEVYPHGAMNVHTSLLPKYRGASPIQKALLEGDTITGVSLMKMSEGMDEGDIYAQSQVPVGQMRYGELEEALMKAALPLLDKTLKDLEAGKAKAWPQDKAHVSYCSKISKELCCVDWSLSANEIEGLVRALWPNPMAYTLRKGERLLLHRVRALDMASSKMPGTVEKVGKEGIYVATGQGQVLIEELQRPGKRTLPADDYLRGNPVGEDEIFGGR